MNRAHMEGTHSTRPVYCLTGVLWVEETTEHLEVCMGV